MRVDLLIRGAEALEADALNPKGVRFDLGVWATPWNRRTKMVTPAKTRTEAKQLKVSCGTAACAMGFFCLAKTFKDEGLTHRVLNVIAGFQIEPVLMKPEVGYRLEGFDAAASLFDIGNRVAEHIFSARFYTTGMVAGASAELAVARRMRLLAAGIDYKLMPDFPVLASY